MRDFDITRDAKTGQFLAGTSGGGQKRGARHRLNGDFVVALQDHFAERGQAAIENRLSREARRISEDHC